MNKLILPVLLLPAAAIAAPKPNVIVIITDQQRAEKVGYLGLEPVVTESMDFIGKSGYTFSNAFCTFPLSTPSRFAMFTGHYPSSFGVRENIKKCEMAPIQQQTMGNLFLNAGYDTYYGGKIHLPETNGNPKAYGFNEYYSTDKKMQLGNEAAKVLDKAVKAGKPFLLVASFINPHDIMGFDGAVTRKEGNAKSNSDPRSAGSYTREAKKMERKSLPQLVANNMPTANTTVAVPGYAPGFDAYQWRMRRWVYDRLTENVDADIEAMVKYIKDNGLLENTIVVFVSDHGDMDGAHGMELKRAPYNECQKVPFIVAGPGIAPGSIDKANFINTGVDLIPTLCELTGIATPAGLPGKSLAPVLTGKTQTIDRDAIFCESDCWFQVIYQNRYKYTLLETAGLPEILIDMQTDPGEMKNVAADPKYKQIRDKLSDMLLKDLARRKIIPNEKGVLNQHYDKKYGRDDEE